MQFPKLAPIRKTGTEKFKAGNNEPRFTVLDFWQWAASDLVSNSTRGVLAEFIVARALGIDSTVRNEWDPFDLQMPSGLKIEVKSAAYVQSWGQKELSTIVFSTRPSFAWDAETGAFATERKRQADVYVFALLAHREKESVDPLNLDQWQFYLVRTSQLDSYERSQHSITLKSLERLCPRPVKFAELAGAVARCSAVL